MVGLQPPQIPHGLRSAVGTRGEKEEFATNRHVHTDTQIHIHVYLEHVLIHNG
jgi:hypothetical protein